MTVEIGEFLGYLASGLVFLTFCMKTMIPLRLLAIGSNLAFISYGLVDGLIPIVILHCMLLPLNLVRLYQMYNLIKTIRQAVRGDLSLDGILPYMTRRRFERGAILFRKGDTAGQMFYMLAGRIHLLEIDKSIGEGTVIGEISMFSPQKERTATARCESDCDLLAIDDDKVMQLYFQNPQFGFALIRLITSRLIENSEAATARITADRSVT